MTTTLSTIVARPDLDIVEDVQTIIVRYPPLNNDRHKIHVTAENGVVFLSGYVSTPINRRWLVDRAAQVRGVIAVNDEALYDDETLRLDVGQVIPPGVIANVRYGVVVLTGRLPEGTTAEALAETVAAIPGVRQVITRFM